jgi:hypothetical protein
MALHRDIFWVGRQWTVTGYGMQAVDQKLKGEFDIEASRLWEDGLLERLQAEKWFNPEDFKKGLAVARTRYPEPAREGAPPEPSLARQEPGAPVERPKPAQPIVAMRVQGSLAKFVRTWRVGVRR